MRCVLDKIIKEKEGRKLHEELKKNWKAGKWGSERWKGDCFGLFPFETGKARLIH